MAHNRSILASETSFDQALVVSYGTTRDEFQQGLPEEILEALPDEVLGAPAASQESQAQDVVVDRIEITQEQLSRGAALLVLAGFGVFIMGYLMGTCKSELSQDLIPAELSRTLLYEDRGPQVSTQKKRAHEYGRFATREEADTLIKELNNQGTYVQVVPHTSYSATGHEYGWYSVCQSTKLDPENS